MILLIFVLTSNIQLAKALEDNDKAKEVSNMIAAVQKSSMSEDSKEKFIKSLDVILDFLMSNSDDIWYESEEGTKTVRTVLEASNDLISSIESKYSSWLNIEATVALKKEACGFLGNGECVYKSAASLLEISRERSRDTGLCVKLLGLAKTVLPLFIAPLESEEYKMVLGMREKKKQLLEKVSKYIKTSAEE